jgi:predicted RNase H-like HicB family nuclease
MKVYEYPVLIERDEDGRYVVSCPALPGCFTEGENYQEAMESMHDAMELYLRDIPEGEIPPADSVRIERLSVAL